MTGRERLLVLGLLCAGLVLGFLVFARWPGLDLWVTGLFFDPATGFVAVDQGPLNVMRLAIWRVSEALLLAATAALAIGLWTRAPVLAVRRRVWAYIVLLYLLGPGLLADAILKPLWGRARPADVVEFGGTLRFTPPHVIAGECSRNCSFVAGEVAGVMALAVSILLILAQFRPLSGTTARRIGLGTCVVLWLFIVFQRIAGGRHFLSDSIFATIAVLIVALLLSAVLFRDPKA
jgi:lipid A 4'-phosphatase